MAERETQFLKDIESSNADVRFAAWRRAGEMDPQVIPALAKVMESSQPGVVRAAREALEVITHSVGVAGSPRRRAVIQQFLKVLESDRAEAVKTHVLRQLSLIGGDETVPVAAKFLKDPKLREEAAFCLERIPGAAADAALAGAIATAPDDFKARLLAALGHRRSEAGIPHAARAMQSSNKDLAVAGAKAWGRIGKKTTTPVKLPERAGLTEWQKTELLDSQLRFADSQAAAGNEAEAIAIYKAFLNEKEEHWQCAALVGLSKIHRPEAAMAIYTKLKSPDPKVRITAIKAWRRHSEA